MKLARRGDGRASAAGSIAIALALAVHTAAVAQEAAPPTQPQCTLPSAPFALTEANRLRGAALTRRIADKTIKYERPLTGPNFDGHVRYRLELRADGSVIMSCETKAEKARNWSPCRRFNEADPKATGRDVGVWRVEGGNLVLQRTALDAQGREETRLALHEESAALAVKRLRGPNYCMSGPIELE